MVADILEYGAIEGNDEKNAKANAKALQAAVDKVSAAGGGRINIPSGVFFCGSILLKSGTELHLERGAMLACSLNPEDIMPFPDDKDTEGIDEVDGFNGGFFLGALHAENISVTGEGIIYGQGDKVFIEPDADGGVYECPKQTTEFRPRLMLFEDVKGLEIKNVTLKDAAFWTLHMAGCENVRVTDINIENDDRGVNNDGIDPDCCKNVMIRGCRVFTADDAIVLKSTRPMAEKYGDCRDITISDCILHSHCSALKIGTETYGTIKNVVMGNCIVQDCTRAVGIWMRDGGSIENVLVHHITGSVRRYAGAYELPGKPGWWGMGEPLFISAVRRKYKTGADNPFNSGEFWKNIKEENGLAFSDSGIGKIKDISFDHIDMECESCCFFAGEEEGDIGNVSLNQVHMTFKKNGTQQGGFFDEQPSVRGVYEHEIPALYARGVKKLNINGFYVDDADGKTAWNGKEFMVEDALPKAKAE